MAATPRIFIFKSGASSNLNAFSYDRLGKGLPEKFAPWNSIGVVRPDQRPPHGLNRDAIETSLGEQGFALWRMKTPA